MPGWLLAAWRVCGAHGFWPCVGFLAQGFVSGGWGRRGLVWVCLSLWISVSILDLGWGLLAGDGAWGLRIFLFLSGSVSMPVRAACAGGCCGA